MKKLLIILTITLIISVCMAGCSNNSDTNNPKFRINDPVPPMPKN